MAALEIQATPTPQLRGIGGLARRTVAEGAAGVQVLLGAAVVLAAWLVVVLGGRAVRPAVVVGAVVALHALDRFDQRMAASLVARAEIPAQPEACLRA